MEHRCRHEDPDWELIDRAEAIEGIRRGLESMARGEGRPVDEAFAELRARYGIPDES